MKYRDVRKTKRYRTERAADGAVLTRSAFELMYLLMVLLMVAAVVFGVVFRIASFTKRSGSSVQRYSVMTEAAGTPRRGDLVTYRKGSGLSAGEIVGMPGERILLGFEVEDSFNRIEYMGRSCFTYDDLRRFVGSDRIPEGFVLVDGDLTGAEQQVVGELIDTKMITGRVTRVIYPFSLFGRQAHNLK